MLSAALVTLLAAGRVAAVPVAQRPVTQDSLTLEQVLLLAQDQGLQAQGARATLAASRYRDQGFTASYRPQLTLGGTLPQYNRTIIPVLQPDGTTLFRSQNQTDMSLTADLTQKLPTGGDVFVSSALSTFAVSTGQTLRTWSSTPVSVGLRQTLFSPNTSAFDRRAQPLRTELAQRQYRETREDIAVSTTNLFFDLYSARVALDNAAANAAVNDTLYTLNKGRFEVGKIGQDDLLQSELALLRARGAHADARIAFDRAEAALRMALNMPPNAPLAIAIPPLIPAYPADTTRAVAEALRNRAGASDSALHAVQAERNIADAKANNGFNATVQASVGFNATASELGSAYRDLLEARQLNVGVQMPLWDWGSRKSAIRAAEADREQAASSARTAMRQIAYDAHFAALAVEQSRTSLMLAAKADTVANKRFEVAYNRYVVGRIAVDNLYLAQSEKDQAIAQYLQSLRAAWVAHYQLRRTTLFDFATQKPIQ
jgi:outer membrane protein